MNVLFVKNRRLMFSVLTLVFGCNVTLAQTAKDSVTHALKQFNKHVYIDNDSAYYYLKEAKFAAMRNTEDLINVYGRTSDYFAFVADDLDTALLYLDKALKLSLTTEDAVLIAQTHNRRGYVLKLQWKIEEAFKSYNNAIEILEKKDKPKLLSNSYVKKGKLYTSAGLYSEAFISFDKALKLAEENEKVSKSFIYRSMGQAYKTQGDYKEAEVYFEKAIEIIKSRKKSKKSQAELNRCRTSLAELAYEMGDFEKAFLLAQESERWIKKVKNKKKLAGLHLLLGKLYYEFENDSLALHFTKKAYEKAVKKNVAKGKVETAKQLALIYERMHNVEKAYEFLQQYDTLKKAYAKEKGEQALLKASFLATITEKDKEFARVQKTMEDEKFYTTLLLIFGLGSGIIFFMFYKRKKIRLVKELEKSKINNVRIKENLAATQKKVLQTKNELKAYSRLISKQVDSEDETLPHTVKPIMKQLHNFKILTEDDWFTFKTLFLNIHPEFYKNFKITVDDYSLGDLKLASLIRLNFNTKEIAKTLAISPESVRKGKYRLRKKMTFTSEKELQKFIYTL